MEPVRVALSLAGIVLVIFAAYYATWFIGAKASGRGHGKLRNKNINLIDRFAISKDKSFCLLEIAGKVYVIGITNQTMTLLDTLDSAEFTETSTERSDSETWHIASGGRLTDRITKKLATFLAHKMGRDFKINMNGNGATFAESMKNAQEKNAPK